MTESVCKQCLQELIQFTDFIKKCYRAKLILLLIETKYDQMPPNSETAIEIFGYNVEDKDDIIVGLCTNKQHNLPIESEKNCEIKMEEQTEESVHVCNLCLQLGKHDLLANEDLNTSLPVLKFMEVKLK